MKLEMSKDFKKQYSKELERYDFEVGVLQDKPHFQPEVAGVNEVQALKSYAGGPARRISRDKSNLTIGQVFIENMKRLNINLLSDPFSRKNEHLVRFMDGFLKLVYGEGMNEKRVVNLIQAVVRNPILKQEYGRNKASTADAKGFSRYMIDTSQTFRAIRAKVNKRARK